MDMSGSSARVAAFRQSIAALLHRNAGGHAEPRHQPPPVENSIDTTVVTADAKRSIHAFLNESYVSSIPRPRSSTETSSIHSSHAASHSHSAGDAAAGEAIDSHLLQPSSTATGLLRPRVHHRSEVHDPGPDLPRVHHLSEMLSLTRSERDDALRQLELLSTSAAAGGDTLAALRVALNDTVTTLAEVQDARGREQSRIAQLEADAVLNEGRIRSLNAQLAVLTEAHTQLQRAHEALKGEHEALRVTAAAAVLRRHAAEAQPVSHPAPAAAIVVDTVAAAQPGDGRVAKERREKRVKKRARDAMVQTGEASSSTPAVLPTPPRAQAAHAVPAAGVPELRIIAGRARVPLPTRTHMLARRPQHIDAARTTHDIIVAPVAEVEPLVAVLERSAAAEVDASVHSVVRDGAAVVDDMSTQRPPHVEPVHAENDRAHEDTVPERVHVFVAKPADTTAIVPATAHAPAASQPQQALGAPMPSLPAVDAPSSPATPSGGPPPVTVRSHESVAALLTAIAALLQDSEVDVSRASLVSGASMYTLDSTPRGKTPSRREPAWGSPATATADV